MILALIYISPLARMFNHTTVPIRLWLWLVLYAPGLYFLDWVRKQAVRYFERKKNVQKDFAATRWEM
jgi:hypothetical protein